MGWCGTAGGLPDAWITFYDSNKFYMGFYHGYLEALLDYAKNSEMGPALNGLNALFCLQILIPRDLGLCLSG